jgi:small subunit ribosomal protein S8e
MAYGRKITSGKYKKQRKKRPQEIQGQKRIVKISEEKRKTIRTKGGHKKLVLLSTTKVNVLDKKTKKTKKAEIKNVLETPANRFFARQQILNKGGIIETSLGKAKITNRPSQEGVINAILIE